MPYEKQATKEEVSRIKLRCWHTKCSKTAIIEDRAGWRWCLKHYWWQKDGYFSKAKKILWKNIIKPRN